MNYLILIIIGYLLGNISFAFIIGKTMGNIDVREHGSKNAGATNVLRTVGKKAALYALLGDIAKGIIPALIGRYFFGLEGAFIASTAAVIGHCYPVFLKFKGGKGVATAGGMILGINPLLGLSILGYVFVVVKFTKYVSLASITAAIMYPLINYFIYHNNTVTILSTVIAVIIVYKHRENIKRLINKEESKTDLFG